MKTFPDCIPCFHKQAMRAAQAATDDPVVIKQVMEEMGLLLGSIDLHQSPPEIADLVYSQVKEVTGVEDPFAEDKRDAIEKALALYPSLKEGNQDSPDPLLAAVVLATAGNAIDLGASSNTTVDDVLKSADRKNFSVFDYGVFRERLAETDRVVYIGDNAGESVFDRLLIEQLGKDVTYIVRDVPIINDVTYEDAVLSGLNKVASLLSSGSRMSGIVPSSCSVQVQNLLKSAELIISKGQGNYEALSNTPYRIFFMLKAKCKYVAEELGADLGDLILKGLNVSCATMKRVS